MPNTRLSDLASGGAITSTDQFYGVETAGVGGVIKTGAQFAEFARDEVGAALTDSGRIDFTLNDVADTITADIIAGSVTFTYLQDVAQDRILGRASAGSGSVEELTPAQGRTVLGLQADAPNLGTEASQLASASTVNIGAAAGWYVDITGTTTITAFDTVDAGIVRIVRFTGALTLTHNATSLILPGGESITTAADDVAVFVSEGSGNWRCLQYTRADGNPLRYEEGSYTPEYKGSVSDPTVTYGFQEGVYTVIGDLVILNLYMTVSSSSGGSGTLQVTLPFTVASSMPTVLGSLVSWAFSWPTTKAPKTMLHNPGTATAALYGANSSDWRDNISAGAFQTSDLTSGDRLGATIAFRRA